ncbi:DEAD/DEAH box helicase [Blochmannia endosymbiont of Camponotus sp. C-003]|uniref:DEAD/DEAH box helicase n=1 Tax=Blochmannia endosymbiont of Camponotus sp. C-003 TaxID=2945588 RepID=UPI00202551C7|nr:DEAD/DEAH box helicase [Blochmannia endosymbiont of Camponotus sp. C-003]URJ23128.1 DEAD/DEAH box helicase [Blochmannia endosymbiont of Camponotus sp. C-003]
MSKTADSFVELGLNRYIVNLLNDIGYEKPLPIQIQCIPYLLAGRDVLGMAHTGSGKTAAFVLPLLHNIDIDNSYSQGLIVTPTRELAIQIGRVCSNFSRYMKKINVVTLYGGQSYGIQLNALNKRPHIIVSTPGRLIDHLNRGTANLSQLKTLVIDEADEMLRMGFIEDIERIVKNIPVKRQTALFSATLPMGIRRISYRFMKNPKEIYIHSNTSMCADIQQSYWLVHGGIAKHDALMRFLETEDFDAAIVFVRTKHATLEISEILERFGYNSAALNGDMNQIVRHQTLDRLRNGKLDILIATDVAARGLDVHRISLVINYDIPISSDAYIHRIGRTGRAGRVGKSLLFVEHKEYRLLRHIERKINLKIPEVKYPTSKTLLACRLSKFTNKVEYQLSVDNDDLSIYRSLLPQIKPKQDLTTENLAAILLKIAQGNRPLVLPPDPVIKNKSVLKMRMNNNRQNCFHADNRVIKTRPQSKISNNMRVYHISVGRNDGVKIRHIIRVLSNKIDNIRYHEIGNIKLFSFHALIELDKALSSSKILMQLSHVRILNKPINMKFLGSISVCNDVH